MMNLFATAEWSTEHGCHNLGVFCDVDSAVDDSSQVACSQILDDETGTTASTITGDHTPRLTA